jgi:hypothetical protein
MSKVQLAGNASGTGIFTIASPNSNTDRTLTLPDSTGTLLNSAAQGIPKSALPTGSVLQVVNATTLSATSTTGSTFIATTLAASITPTSSSSKILIFGQGFCYGTQSQSQPQITLYRGGTDIVGTNYGFGDIYANASGYMEGMLPFSFLDSPATTSSTTYTIYMRNNNVGTAAFGASDRRSVITLLEIAA